MPDDSVREPVNVRRAREAVEFLASENNGLRAEVAALRAELRRYQFECNNHMAEVDRMRAELERSINAEVEHSGRAAMLEAERDRLVATLAVVQGVLSDTEASHERMRAVVEAVTLYHPSDLPAPIREAVDAYREATDAD